MEKFLDFLGTVTIITGFFIHPIWILTIIIAAIRLFNFGDQQHY